MSCSSPLIAGLLLSALAYLVYILLSFRDRAIGTTKRRDPHFSDVPGWPLIGHLPGVITNRSRPLEWASMRAFSHHPGHSITIPGLRLIDISKPEWIEYVQKTNFQNYVKGSLFQSVMADVFGNGIFASDGANWKKTRQSTSAIFNVMSFKSIMIPSVQSSLDSLIHIMESASRGGQTLDFCNLFYKFTLESFMKMTFGKDVDLLLSHLHLNQKRESTQSPEFSTTSFAESFDFAQNQLDLRFSLVTGWKLYESVNYPLGQRMKSACTRLEDYAYSLIDERTSAVANANSIQAKRALHSKDLLGLFMQARDDRGGGLGRTELKDAVLNLIIAGRDTTAQALSWAFYHLIINPNVSQRVRQEAEEILESDPDGRVTYENHKRFKWTQAVIFETLRLHPSVPKNVKFALKHDQIPGGPVIEPGNAVRWSDWQMGRDSDIWGPDCGEFRPERWIDDSGNLKQFGQFRFHAFNGGPRLCLGMNLAIFETVAAIVTVLYTFRLQFAPGWLEQVSKSELMPGIPTRYPTPKYRPSLTLPMKNPMVVSLDSRNL